MVINRSTSDGNAITVADIEPIGIVTKRVRITILVVNCDTTDCETGRARDAEDLNGRILDVQPGDSGGSLETVGEEELRLDVGLAVGTLSIPPAGTLAIDEVTGSSRNLDVGSRDGDQRASPLLIAESSGSLKNHLQNFQ